MLTCRPCNVDPLETLGFTGVYIIFLFFFSKNIDCEYSLERVGLDSEKRIVSEKRRKDAKRA